MSGFISFIPFSLSKNKQLAPCTSNLEVFLQVIFWTIVHSLTSCLTHKHVCIIYYLNWHSKIDSPQNYCLISTFKLLNILFPTTCCCTYDVRNSDYFRRIFGIISRDHSYNRVLSFDPPKNITGSFARNIPSGSDLHQVHFSILSESHRARSAALSGIITFSQHWSRKLRGSQSQEIIPLLLRLTSSSTQMLS